MCVYTPYTVALAAPVTFPDYIIERVAVEEYRGGTTAF